MAVTTSSSAGSAASLAELHWPPVASRRSYRRQQMWQSGRRPLAHQATVENRTAPNAETAAPHRVWETLVTGSGVWGLGSGIVWRVAVSGPLRAADGNANMLTARLGRLCGWTWGRFTGSRRQVAGRATHNTQHATHNGQHRQTGINPGLN
eukprot:gene21744-26300_t